MSIIVYQYPKCSTCRKALAFLEQEGVDFESQDIVASPPTKALLAKVHKTFGVPLKRLFNTSGQSYRDGDFKDKLPSMSESEALAALAADGKLIKRPLLITEGSALTGFREDEWRQALR